MYHKRGIVIKNDEFCSACVRRAGPVRFLLKNVDFLLKNVDFPLKNVDFIFTRATELGGVRKL